MIKTAAKHVAGAIWQHVTTNVTGSILEFLFKVLYTHVLGKKWHHLNVDPDELYDRLGYRDAKKWELVHTPISTTRYSTILSIAHLCGSWCFVYTECRSDSHGGKRVVYRIVTRREICMNICNMLSPVTTEQKTVIVYTTDRGRSNWCDQFAVRGRKLSEIAITDEVRTEFVDRIMKWSTEEEWYRKMNLPHRIGFLLLGPKGTGKTTLIRSIATELDLPVFVVNPSVTDDITITPLMTNSSRRRIIVIEDADSFKSLHHRDVALSVPDNKLSPGLSTSGILNGLDGLVPAENVIFIFTANTNPFEDALLREGRLSYTVYVGPLSPKEIKKYLRDRYDEPDVDLSVITNRITGSDLQKCIVRNPRSLADVVKNIVELGDFEDAQTHA